MVYCKSVVFAFMDPSFYGFIILAAIIFAVVCAGFTGDVAGSKGWDGTQWFLRGLLFGPLALLAACGLPDKKIRNNLRALVEKFEAVDKTNAKYREENY